MVIITPRLAAPLSCRTEESACGWVAQLVNWLHSMNCEQKNWISLCQLKVLVNLVISIKTCRWPFLLPLTVNYMSQLEAKGYFGSASREKNPTIFHPASKDPQSHQTQEHSERRYPLLPWPRRHLSIIHFLCKSHHFFCQTVPIT